MRQFEDYCFVVQGAVDLRSYKGSYVTLEVLESIAISKFKYNTNNQHDPSVAKANTFICLTINNCISV